MHALSKISENLKNSNKIMCNNVVKWLDKFTNIRYTGSSSNLDFFREFAHAFSINACLDSLGNP